MLTTPTRLLAIACGALTAAAHAQAPTPAQLRADLDVFRRSFLAVDQSYAPPARAEAEQRLASLEARIGSVSVATFELELARIVALADNGHTNSPASRRSPRYSRVRVRFVPFGTDFFILRADTANRDLLGARLVAVEGRPFADVRAVAHTLWGGTPAFRDRHVPFFLESPDQLKELGIAASGESATYRLALRDGRTIDRRLVADPPDDTRERYGAGRWLYPEPIATDHGDWVALGQVGRMPWSLSAPDEFFRWRAAPEIDGLVVELRMNRDATGRPIRDFLATVTAELRRARPLNLVLDLRANGGGDLNTTRDFVQALPALVRGRLFVLTSPWTFSAAISTTGYLEQAAPDRVTIVGEMVGDRQEFWAEGGLVTLPATGAAMSVARERHDYRTGCARFRDCHGSVVRHPIAVASLAPDIAAPMTIEAYIAGRDPAMEAVVAALNPRPGEPRR